MITATLRLTVSNSTREDIIRLFRSLIEPTRVEIGCVKCALYVDLHDRDTILWLEEWQTHEDLERRLRSQQYKKVLAAFDMSIGEPEIRFDTVAETKGLQVIEEARGSGILPRRPADFDQ